MMMKKTSAALLASLMAATALTASMAAEPPVMLSPNFSRAMPPGPDTRVKITEEYARLSGVTRISGHGRW
jgi:ABC-type sugar transport system substrate-binding protein